MQTSEINFFYLFLLFLVFKNRAFQNVISKSNLYSKYHYYWCLLHLLICILFNLDPSGEVSDVDEYQAKDTPIEGDRHSLIMNVLSHLKLGTDLTNVRF